jgi:hypothetical protein
MQWGHGMPCPCALPAARGTTTGRRFSDAGSAGALAEASAEGCALAANPED